ncbi:MAG: cupredoxin family copper-binding protein [Candidatus Yonathbacteria bacterium]|nr:cupredoxin family copper-binding protein [Candidatus Yonathbacteria bacterium]
MKKTLLIFVVLVLIGLAFWLWYAPRKVEMEGNAPLATQKDEEPAMPSSAQTNAVSKSAGTFVSISNFTFSPNRIQVKKGGAVVWTNKDAMAHTVTSDSLLFNGSSLEKDGAFSFTFTQTGIYSYHCAFHPSMRGVVEVTE